MIPYWESPKLYAKILWKNFLRQMIFHFCFYDPFCTNIEVLEILCLECYFFYKSILTGFATYVGMVLLYHAFWDRGEPFFLKNRTAWGRIFLTKRPQRVQMCAPHCFVISNTCVHSIPQYAILLRKLTKSINHGQNYFVRFFIFCV